MDALEFFELCSLGDWRTVKQSLKNGRVDVNFQHKINGWTALHWASRRGHKSIVELLLKHGADPSLTDAQGRTAADVSSDRSIVELLGGPTQSDQIDQPELPIVPNYLRNPIFPYARKPIVENYHQSTATSSSGDDRSNSSSRSGILSMMAVSGGIAIGVIALGLIWRQLGPRR